MEKHEAGASMIGYLYQVRYALLYLLKTDDAFARMSIEKFDDIALESEDGSPLELIQTKCHTLRNGNLTDYSTDLWRTLKVWIDAVSNDQTLLDHTKFVIITTSAVPNDSAMEKIQTSQTVDAYTMLKSVAEAGGNEAHSKYYSAFLDFNESQMKVLLSQVKVISGASDIQDTLDDIKRSIRIGCRPQHLDIIAERVEGWWIQEVIKALMSYDPVLMSQVDLHKKVYDISREYDDNNLPIDCRDLNPVGERDLNPKERVFLEQLRLLQSRNTTLNLAIRDYYRASTQRSSWLRQGLVQPGDLDSYENILIEAWERSFAAMEDDLSDYVSPTDHEKMKEGRVLYRKVSDLNLRIRDKCDAPFVMHGTYHILANDLTVGWHVDFKQRLAHLLKGE